MLAPRASMTAPENAAARAIPSPSPALVQTSPSVSRAFGDEPLDERERADQHRRAGQAGEQADGAEQPQRVDERERQHHHCQHAGGQQQLPVQPDPQVHRAEREPGGTGAQRVQPEQDTGDALHPVLVGERDRHDLERAEQPAEQDEDEGHGGDAGVRQRGAAAALGLGRRWRFGRGLRREQRGPDTEQHCAERERRPVPDGDREIVATGGPATKISSSMTDSSRRRCAAAAGRRPSSAAHRARTIAPMLGMRAPCSATARNSTGRGSTLQHQQDEGPEGHDVPRGQPRQDAPLPEPVDEACQHRADDGVAQRPGRRERAGEGIAAGLDRDEQHDAEADHGDRQPGHERRRRHRQRPGPT